MLGFLLGLIDPITKITTAIFEAKKVVVNAKTEQERIAADERVASLEKRRDVMVAEIPFTRANAWVRSFIALPIGLLIWKIYAWDKVVGSFVGCAGTGGADKGCAVFRTDPLSQELWSIVMMVLGFYFLYEAASAAARLFKR